MSLLPTNIPFGDVVTNGAKSINDFTNDIGKDISNFIGNSPSTSDDRISFQKVRAFYNQNELSRKNLFQVIIHQNNLLYKIFRSTSLDSGTLFLTCESAEIPGLTFNNVEQKIYGIKEEFPSFNAYNNIQLSFLVREKSFMERNIFEAWMRGISPANNYNFNYKNEYATTIQILQYSTSGEMIHLVDLLEAFPFAINQLELNWAEEGVHRLTVSFAYTQFLPGIVEYKEPKISTVNQIGQAIATGIKVAQVVNTGVQAAKVFKKSPLLGIGVASSALGSFNISRVVNVSRGINTVFK
jgi:hypothetical protein